MKIIVAGDSCPMGDYESAISDPKFFDDFKQFFSRADLVLANLECPLTYQQTPIQKGGPHLAASPQTAHGIGRMGIHGVTLANNHIMDHGPEGLDSTVRALQSAGIQYFGAGANLAEASAPLTWSNGSEKCFIWGFAEHEYSIADTDKPGAAPADLIAIIRALKSKPSDIPAIVLLHAGNEHYPYPSPWLQDRCRLMIELGATAVICQHTHCIGSYETWNQGLIVYGQGNFFFDYPSNQPTWHQGLLIEINLSGPMLESFQFIPIEQTKHAPFLKFSEGSVKDKIVSDFQTRSELIKDPAALSLQWQNFTFFKKNQYQSLLFGHSRLEYILNKFIGFADWKSNQAKMNIGNILRCDSHYEVIKTLYSQNITTSKSR